MSQEVCTGIVSDRKLRPGEGEAITELLFHEIPLPTAQKIIDDVYPIIALAVLTYLRESQEKRYGSESWS